jgi:hypothetical protein
MCSVYKKEYRILKPVETTTRKGLKQKEEKEQMNQIVLYCIYTLKCHKETPFIAILNKQKCHVIPFFFYKN